MRVIRAMRSVTNRPIKDIFLHNFLSFILKLVSYLRMNGRYIILFRSRSNYITMIVEMMISTVVDKLVIFN